MTPSRSECRRPEAPSIDEARSLVLIFRPSRRRPLLIDLRHELIKLRRFALPASGWLCTAQAGFFLCCSRHSIGDRIRRGLIPAEAVERPDGRGLGFVYRLRPEDVLAAIERELGV